MLLPLPVCHMMLATCHPTSDTVTALLTVVSFVKALVGLEEAEIENDFDWTPDNYGRSVFTSLFTQTDKMKVRSA